MSSGDQNKFTGIQTDHPIRARRSDLVLINKKKRTCHLVHSGEPLNENEQRQKDSQILGFFKGTKKFEEHEVTVISIVAVALGMVP